MPKSYSPEKQNKIALISMKILEEKISKFDNWIQPWTFYSYIANDKNLTDQQLYLFNEIWTKAGGAEIWNNQDLALCCKTSYEFIAENYSLTEESIAIIVRALSYQWR